MSNNRAYIAMFLGAVALSTSAIFVKLTEAPASVIAFYRMLFSALLIMPLLMADARSSLRHIRSFTRRQWMMCLLAGFFLAVHFVLWFESLNYTSVTSSTVLVTLQPLFAIAGGAWLFRERLRMAAIGGGLLAIAGSFIIGWGDMQISGLALFGDLLALMGAAVVTVYFMIGQSVRKELELFPYTFIVYAASALYLLVYCLATGEALTGYESSDWLWMFLLALIPTVFGQTVFNWLVKWLSATTISMSILLEPVGTAILAYFILGEMVTLRQIIGGSVILCGVGIFLYYNGRRRAKDNCYGSIKQSNVYRAD
ncbi:DMT family transporter [Paenibacillus chungangensis]|uniref:DMT family transporter n=1 Tax=Paenibacillus chungangensis TaxID=696535 RepID=A0ABW3HRQ4_9BACL